MDLAVVVEQVQHVAAVRADGGVEREQLEGPLRGVGRLESWLAGTKAALTSKLATKVSFPEKTIAECTRSTTRDAINDKARADTLEAAPSLADALDSAAITAGRVDAVTTATKSLDTDQRDELIERLDGGLLDVAAVASVDEWRRRLAMEVKNIQRDDGIDRLERQKRATSVRTWTDGEGMWCLSGRFDPVTGVKLAAKLDRAVNALFAEQTPSTCPADPIEKAAPPRRACPRRVDRRQRRRRTAGSGRVRGRGRQLTARRWRRTCGRLGIPVEVPARVLAEMIDEGDVQAVAVRNGVVLHAPGRLDLGRSTRLASRAQRRALRALYATCAIPGCSVRYDRCKLHHVVWWRNGGRTDLENLLAVCVHHHSKVHDAGWNLELGPNRQLTIHFPDGTIHNTGPPSRRAA